MSVASPSIDSASKLIKVMADGQFTSPAEADREAWRRFAAVHGACVGGSRGAADRIGHASDVAVTRRSRLALGLAW